MKGDAIVSLVVVVPAFIGGVYFTGKAIFHMYHVVTNTTGKYANFLGPFALLSASQFNSEGNRHRVALVPALLGLAICWGALFAVGAVHVSK